MAEALVRIRTESARASAVEEAARRKIFEEEATTTAMKAEAFERKKNEMNQRIAVVEHELIELAAKRKLLDERIARLGAALGLERPLVVKAGQLFYLRKDKENNKQSEWHEHYFELLSLVRDEDSTPLGPALQFYSSEDQTKLIELILLHDCQLITDDETSFRLEHIEHQHIRYFRGPDAHAWLASLSTLISDYAQELAHTSSKQHRNLRHAAIRSARTHLELIFGGGGGLLTHA